MSFSKLLSTLFEVNFVMLLMGVVFIFFIDKSSPENRYCKLLTVFIGIMILWRFFVAQVSGRYWIAIIIPSFLIISYFFYYMGWGIRMARIMLAITVLTCLGKDFNFNWNNDAIIRIADTINKDMTQYDHVLCSEIGPKTKIISRMEFYTNSKILKNAAANKVEIKDIYEGAKGLYDVLYLVAEQKPDVADKLKDSVAALGGVELQSEYKDMHKKNKIYLYKISVPSQREQIPEKRLWLLPNGDFEEHLLSTQAGKTRIAPKQWTVSQDIRVDDKIAPISGKYSLSFPDGRFASVCSTQVKIPAGCELLIFSIRDAGGANLYVRGYSSTKKQKTPSAETLMSIVVPNNELHQFHIPLPRNMQEAERVSFGFYGSAPNGFVLDRIGLYPVRNSN